MDRPFSRSLQRRRRTDTWIGYGFIAWMMSGLPVFLWLRSFGVEYVAVAFAIWLWGAIVLGWLFGFLPRRLAVVLWLRKFHRERYPEFPLSRAFVHLSSLGLQTVSLADTSVRAQRTRNWARGTGLGFILFLAGLTIFASPLTPEHWREAAGSRYFDYLVEVTAVSGNRLFDTFLFVVAFVSIPAALALGPGIAAAYLMNYLGWGSVKLNTDSERTKSSIAKVGRLRLPGDIVLFRTRDENWQQHVAAMIANTDFIAVDLAQPSQHIAWEIEQIIQHGKCHRTLWMWPSVRSCPISESADGDLSILGQKIGKLAFGVVYPRDASSNDYSDPRYVSIGAQRIGQSLLEALEVVMASTERATGLIVFRALPQHDSVFSQ